MNSLSFVNTTETLNFTIEFSNKFKVFSEIILSSACVNVKEQHTLQILNK